MAEATPKQLVPYGTEHPDYPNAPSDWDGGPYLCRDAAAEITRLRAQLAEAELRGVKAGLDEAAKWLDNWGDATMGQEIGSYYAATAIRAIDPTTLTAGEGDHG